MWSGGPQWTQWALNPSAYQNVSHEQIDWAALAQQWIKMKESHSVPPPVHLQAPPPPPPPPPLPPPQQRQQEEVKEKEVATRDAEEGGEAPMEMDAKEEEEELTASATVAPTTSVNPPATSAPPPDAGSSWGSWNNWQQPQHWGPGWHGPGVGTAATWAGPPSHPPPNHPHAHIAPPAGGKDPPSVSVGVPPPPHQMGAHFPFPPHNASGPIYGEHNHPPSFDYNHGAEGVDHFGQVGFWDAGEAGGDMGPSPFIRHNRHGDWRGNRGPPGMPGRPYHDHQSRHGPSEHSDEEDDQSGGTVLDAAKRRQLPAWIREGLEKMEREKMKQIERERQIKEREAVARKLKDQEQLAARELGEKEDGVVTSNMASIPKRSKFESDSEEEEDVNPEETSDRSMEWRAGIGPLKRRKRSRFQDASSPGSTSPHETASGMKAAVGHPNGRRKIPEIVEDDVDRGRSPPPALLSREELMQETMLKVRRLLTEVLLEVTNEEMHLVAKEVLSKAKSKAPALQLRKTPALATLTGQLGLGMYGDSESSEEDSDIGDSSKGDRYGRRRNVDPESDSDEELKDQIRRRKQEFVQTEREIEAQLQEEEERERERERERRLKGEEAPGGEEGGEGDIEAKESAGEEEEEEERQVEKETDTKHPSLQQEGLDTQKPKFSRLPDDKEAAEFVGEVKEEKQVKGKDDEVRVGDTKSRPTQAATDKANATSHASKKHERKKKESKRKKKVKGTSSQSESHTSSHSSSSTSSSDSSSSSSSSDSTSSSRSSSPSSSSESSDSRHQSRKRSKPNKEVLRKDVKSRRGGGSRDSKSVRRRSRSRERSRSRGRGRGEGRKQREGGSNRRDDERERRRSGGGHRGSRSPDRKDRRRGGGSEKDGSSGGGRRRNSRRSVTPRKGHRSRSRSDRRRHSGGGRRSSSRSSSYAELNKKQGHSHRD